jgi:CSLREA domain-containing protein
MRWCAQIAPTDRRHWMEGTSMAGHPLRRTLVALVGLVLAIAASLGAPPGASGTEPPDLFLTVNTTDNLDDGVCDHPILTGDDHCSLREAINSVNNGVGDGIKFDTTVFDPADPGVIPIETGEGCLPTITRSVLIDATEAGVILDGDLDDNGTSEPCVVALRASLGMDGMHFRLRAAEELFGIRQFPGTGIAVIGSGNRLGNVLVDHVEVADVGNVGVSVTGARSAVSITVIGSVIDTESGGEDAGDGVLIDLAGPQSEDSVITVTDNEVRAAEDAIDINLDGNINTLAPTITATITGNQELNGGGELGERGVEVSYCEGGGCAIHDSTLTVTITGNGQIISDDDAVDVDVFANGSSDGSEINVDVIGNQDLISNTAAADIGVLLCCGDGDNDVNVRVNENGEVRGDNGGATVDVNTCCGSGDRHFIDIYENAEIDGGLGYGVGITARAGPDVAAAPGDGDDSSIEIQVEDNGEIRGGEDGVDIDAHAGANGGAADRNESRVTVAGNGPITGDEDGVKIDSEAGSRTGTGGDNRSEVAVDGNGDITGDSGDGIDVESHARGPGGASSGNSSSVTASGNGVMSGALAGARIGALAGSKSAAADDNSSQVEVSGNGPITGGDESAIEVDSGCGCGGSGNTSQVEVSGNGDITGGADGVEIQRTADGSSWGDGVQVASSTAGQESNVHRITFVDNGVVRGDAGDGLRVGVCPYVTGAAAAVLCLQNSTTILTVTGNEFDNSEESGIAVCCGDFEAVSGKSAISGNILTGNGENGIELDSVSGVNVGPDNVISGNGRGPNDAGIEVVNTTSFAIWEDSDDSGDPLCGSLCDVTLPAGGNAITRNSIFDNVGPGIDLQGLDAPGGSYSDASLAGCVSIGKALIDPNGCLASPEVNLVASGDKVGGTACQNCTIDLYLADADPADNAEGDPLDRQHGEGRTYLGSGTAAADGTFSIILPCGLSGGDLTATATDAAKSTSEFSANRPFLGSATCTEQSPTPTRTATATAPGPQPTSTLPAPPPTATATSLAKPCGDVNDSGGVDSIDASLILQVTAGLIDELDNPESADADGDGSISAIDASLVLQATAGLIDPDDLDC